MDAIPAPARRRGVMLVAAGLMLVIVAAASLGTAGWLRRRPSTTSTPNVAATVQAENWILTNVAGDQRLVGDDRLRADLVVRGLSDGRVVTVESAGWLAPSFA